MVIDAVFYRESKSEVRNSQILCEHSVQIKICKRVVKEIQNVSEDVNKVNLWWKNKLLRILLVFILSGLGSVLGTYVGAYKIISNLF